MLLACGEDGLFSHGMVRMFTYKQRSSAFIPIVLM